MSERDQTGEGGRTELARALLLAGVILTGFGILLGSAPLFDPDEARNALIAREMARSGDYLLPRISGLPFLDKPFLYFAAEALAMRWLGESELAARLPSALFAFGTVLLTALFARRELGAAPARLAALACAATPLFLAFARIAIMDSCLSLFVVAAILAFHRAIESDGAAGSNLVSRRWNLAAWIAMALGVLVKGPVGLLLPLLVAVPYSVWRRRHRAIWRLGGPVALLLLIVPWLAAVEARAPGFLRYALITETLARLSGNELNRSEPLWYFLPLVLVAGFPWSWLAIAGARQAWISSRKDVEAKRELVFLALWILVPLLFFSLAESKRPQYMLPLVPALALWVARSGSVGDSRRERLPGAVVAAIGWLFASAAMLAVHFGVGDLDSALATNSFAAAGGFALRFASVAAVAGALALFTVRWRRRTEWTAWALAAPVLLLPWISADLLPEVAAARSGKALARALEPRLEARTEVVGIETFSPSLAFYLDRPILVSSVDGKVFTSNSVLRGYSELVDVEGGALKSENYWHRSALAGDRPTIFLARAHFLDSQQTLLDLGYRRVFEGRIRAFARDLGPGEARTPRGDAP